jgi:hypothetical protein
MNEQGGFESVTPADLVQMKGFINTNRSLTTPFDYVTEGKTGDLEPAQAAEKLQQWAEAGATWWVESLWDATAEQAERRLKLGPPAL